LSVNCSDVKEKGVDQLVPVRLDRSLAKPQSPKGFTSSEMPSPVVNKPTALKCIDPNKVGYTRPKIATVEVKQQSKPDQKSMNVPKPTNVKENSNPQVLPKFLTQTILKRSDGISTGGRQTPLDVKPSRNIEGRSYTPRPVKDPASGSQNPRLSVDKNKVNKIAPSKGQVTAKPNNTGQFDNKGSARCKINPVKQNIQLKTKESVQVSQNRGNFKIFV